MTKAKSKSVIARSGVKSPHVRRIKLPKDTMDDLDKFDPIGEEADFTKQLESLMESTSTVMTDPRMDHRELPYAKNYYEWITGKDFLGFNAFSRQVDIGLQLNNDVCWNCSPEFYDGPDVDHTWHFTEYRRLFQIMDNGVCPECGATRLQGIQKGILFDKYLHSGIAGQRCKSKTALLSSDSGMKYIYEFTQEHKAVDGFQTYKSKTKISLEDGQLVKPSDFYRSPPEFTLTAKTDYCYEDGGTYDHPLMTSKGFVKLKDMKIGDVIPIYLGQNVWSKTNVDYITDDTARLLGFWIAEGSYSEVNNKYPVLRISNYNTDVLDFCYKILPELGLTPTYGGYSELGDGKPTEVFTYIKGVNLDDVFGFDKDGERFYTKGQFYRQIPRSVRMSSKSAICAFLQGLYEGDGCAEDTAKNMVVSYVTCSETLAKELQIILANLGIAALRSSEKRKWVNPQGKKMKGVYWKIVISGHYNLKLFQEHVNFFSDNKRKKLDYIVRNTKDASTQGSIPTSAECLPLPVLEEFTDIISAIETFFERENVRFVTKQTTGRTSSHTVTFASFFTTEQKKQLQPSRLFKRTKITRYMLAKVESIMRASEHWSSIPAYLQKELLHFFDKYLDPDVIWMEVKSITKSKTKEHTYDFEIPKYHRFMANGFLNHNSSKCIVGDTIVSTPDGPRYVQQFVKQHVRKVRLPFTDAFVNTHIEKKSNYYSVSTSHGIDIGITDNHRMFCVEHGYTKIKDKTKTALRVGQHLHVPKLSPIDRVRTPVDDLDARRARNTVSLMGNVTLGKPFILTNFRNLKSFIECVFTQSYAYREALFAEILCMAHMPRISDITKIEFQIKNKALSVACRAWLECIGVRCYATDNSYIFTVDSRDFIKRGPAFILSKEMRAHYWKTYKKPKIRVPVSLHLSSKILAVLHNIDKLQNSLGGESLWAGNNRALTDVAEMYALYNVCLQNGGYIRDEKLQGAINICHRWRKLAWKASQLADLNELTNLFKLFSESRFARITKIELQEKKAQVFDISVPNHLWFVANGYHSHNSVLTGHNIGYSIHRLIGTGDPAAYYSLLPGTVLTCILTATTVMNAERNLYTPMRSMFTLTPWFKTFTDWCKEKEKLLGIELVRVKETFTIFRFGGIAVRVLAPDGRTIRGYTTFATAIDEFGFFDATKGEAIKINGSEIYNALLASLVTVMGAANKLRGDGDNDVVYPVAHVVSSPFSINDPIVTLHKRQKDDPFALTYKIPTWKFNPTLTYELCKKIADTEDASQFMRNFGCVVNAASGSFFEKTEMLLNLCDRHPNAVRLDPELYTSPKGTVYTTARIHSKWKAGDDMVCGLALDAGMVKNSYAFCVFHIEQLDADEVDVNEDEEDFDAIDDDTSPGREAVKDDGDLDDDDMEMDNFILVIDAIGEIQPSLEHPIHFTQNVKNVLWPLIEDFNIRLIVSDRWQTLQTQQDLEDEFDVSHQIITPKIGDFHTFKQSVFAECIVLPRCEVDDDEIESLASPEDFKKYPVAHAIRQSITVVEKLKTVEKGNVFSDDLFRVMVLANIVRCTEELREEILSDMSPEQTGLASIVVTEKDYKTEKRAEGTSAVVLQSHFNPVTTVVKKKDEEEEKKTVASMVAGSRG